MLKVKQRLIVEYDAPQRRAVLRLAELHNAVVVPNADQNKEIQTPEGHWRMTLERLDHTMSEHN